jgi:hypothetical protein
VLDILRKREDTLARMPCEAHRVAAIREQRDGMLEIPDSTAAGA